MALPSTVLGHPWDGAPFFSVADWDGTNWTEIDTFNAGNIVFTCAIHPDENAIAIGRQHVGNLALQMLLYDGTNLTEAVGSPINTGTNQCFGLAFSPNGQYLMAGGNAAPIHLYEWNGNSLSLVTTYNIPTGGAHGIAWHPDGRFIAIAYTNQAANLGYLDIVEFDGSSLNLVARASAPVWLPQILGRSVSWRPDGKFLAFSCGRTPPAGGDVRLFSWDGTNLTLLNTYQFGADYAFDVDWNPLSDDIAVAHADGDGFTILRKESNSLVYVTSDALGPGVQGHGCSWRSDGAYVVVGKDGPAWQVINVYSWDSINLILLAQPATANVVNRKPRFFKYYGIIPPPPEVTEVQPAKYRLKVGKYILQCEADKQNLLEANFTLRQNGGCAEFDFKVGRPDFDISLGDELLVYLYGHTDPWYRGRILERSLAGSSSPIRNYSGYGHFEFLNGGQLVNVTFSAAGISDLRLAVIHVLDTYVRPYVDSTLITTSDDKIEDPSHAIVELTFDMVKPIDALSNLCELAEGYEFGVDQDGDFYFRKESPAILEHKWVGKHVGTYIPTENMRNLVNRWRLEGGRLTGGSNYDSMVEDTGAGSSQEQFGLRADKATIPAGMNTSEISRWGEDLLAKSKDPTIKAVVTGINIERTHTRIWPRGKMKLTSEDGKYSHNFAIRAVTYHITPSGITADIALGPKATHIRDYFADLDKKIKKEREQLAIDVYQLALGTGLIADVIKDWHIDWGTLANQVSGLDMPIADGGDHYPTHNVEAALQQVADNQENAMVLIYMGL